MNRARYMPWLLLLTVVLMLAATAAAQNRLLNVSYDPTRELYADYNAAFIRHHKAATGQDVTIDQSHGGSGKQARAVADGQEADVVTLALAADIDVLVRAKVLATDWQSRLPHNATPFSTTIVFLVRKGNRKQIKDWPDLIKDGVEVITPSPKTSGGARWNYLAAYGWALKHHGNDPAKARAYLAELFRHVPILDNGARGSTATFIQRNQGDVLLAWENEALLATTGRGASRFEIVYPSASIVAEPPVAVVDKYVDKHGTRALATAYLQFGYTPEGQDIAARHGYRPSDQAVLKRYVDKFKPIERFTLADLYPDGWPAAQKEHFSDGGVFDQISKR
jgi:sulfate/thiosulfate transport system substrate-binding protein